MACVGAGGAMSNCLWVWFESQPPALAHLLPYLTCQSNKVTKCVPQVYCAAQLLDPTNLLHPNNFREPNGPGATATTTFEPAGSDGEDALFARARASLQVRVCLTLQKCIWCCCKDECTSVSPLVFALGWVPAGFVTCFVRLLHAARRLAEEPSHNRREQR